MTGWFVRVAGAVILPLVVLIGCRGPDDDSAADSDTDGDTDSDTDTDEPFVVSCDTTVVATEPCLVAADGSGTYTTIQEAVDLASEGDVITVCPGYYDSVVIDRVGVTLAGYGADSTCIIGTAGPGISIRGTSSGAMVYVDISGFTVSGVGDENTAGAITAGFVSGTIHDLRVAGVEPGDSGTRAAGAVGFGDLSWERVTFEHNLVDYALHAGDYRTTIRHCVFRNNVTGVGSFAASDTSMLEVTNCLFIGSSYHGLTGGGGVGSIANNVFQGNTSGLAFNEGPASVVIRNNVAASNGVGFSGLLYSIDYNVGWDNGTDFWSGSGPHDTSIDPQFEDAAAGDFRLRSTSPLIDAGDPDPAYNDVDGSRNDIGIFGGRYGSWTPP